MPNNSEDIIVTCIKNIEDMYKEKEYEIPIELEKKMYDVIYKGYEILSDMIEENDYSKTKENKK